MGIFGYPARKLTVIGVTGTDGKTTTVNLIYEMLRAAGFKVGLVSTVWVKINGEVVNMRLHVTNPDARGLQGLLRRMVEAGCTHAVLEVTSHGLDQNRAVGCNFYVGVLTNITHEHLDYHGSFEDYKEAKLRLFRDAKYAVLNQDDSSFGWFKSRISNLKCQKIIQYTKSKISSVSPTLAGDYNKYNIGAAEAVSKIFKIQDSIINKVVKEFKGVPGRREEVRMGQNFRCIVDFAHTPNALEQLLKSLKTERAPKSKLILVFGCTGERDRGKRPIMGEIAARLADQVVITSDDVRGEDQNQIVRDILSGILPSDLPPNLGGRNKDGSIGKIWVENDRDKAIEMAVEMARPGDIVVAAGMGHETTQLVGKREITRSDRQAFEKALAV